MLNQLVIARCHSHPNILLCYLSNNQCYVYINMWGSSKCCQMLNVSNIWSNTKIVLVSSYAYITPSKKCSIFFNFIVKCVYVIFTNGWTGTLYCHPNEIYKIYLFIYNFYYKKNHKTTFKFFLFNFNLFFSVNIFKLLNFVLPFKMTNPVCYQIVYATILNQGYSFNKYM